MFVSYAARRICKRSICLHVLVTDPSDPSAYRNDKHGHVSAPSVFRRILYLRVLLSDSTTATTTPVFIFVFIFVSISVRRTDMARGPGGTPPDTDIIA